MDKHEIAHVLDEIALLLEVQGENPFKVRAYHTAARALESLDEDLEKVIREGRLQEIPGIGERIAKKITTLFDTGSLPYFQKLQQAVPSILIELMDVPGLGAKRANFLYEKLKITSIEELFQACIEGRVAELVGFGTKAQTNILKNIEKLKKYGRRLLWWSAGKIALYTAEKLAKLQSVKKVDIAGSFRRKLETVGDLDFVVASSEPEKIMEWFTQQSSI